MGRQPLHTVGDVTPFSEQWERGDISTEEFVERQTRLILGLKDRIEPLKEMQDNERKRLEPAIRALGGEVKLPGIGKWLFTRASEGHSYDKEAVDELVDKLDEMGYHDIAQALRACRKEANRGSQFKFMPEKGS